MRGESGELVGSGAEPDPWRADERLGHWGWFAGIAIAHFAQVVAISLLAICNAVKHIRPALDRGRAENRRPVLVWQGPFVLQQYLQKRPV